MRDRDRILHCKAFRRLQHKTQCFVSERGDHFRTRLTHTLEVSQVARTISRALRLNEDLTEAIALGHDLGHTPFGHMGERTLNRLCTCGFAHNEQSLRVVRYLEADGGLNLTFDVMDGIVSHRKEGRPITLEGCVVSLSDRIAYINHDIDDAIRAGVLTQEDLPNRLLRVLGKTHGHRIETMVRDVIETSADNCYVKMSAAIDEATEELRDFMFSHVYNREEALREEEKAGKILEDLFYYFMSVDNLKDVRFVLGKTDTKERVVCDFVAGMTDRFALNLHDRLTKGKFLGKV
jgi:dGTPase